MLDKFLKRAASAFLVLALFMTSFVGGVHAGDDLFYGTSGYASGKAIVDIDVDRDTPFHKGQLLIEFKERLGKPFNETGWKEEFKSLQINGEVFELRKNEMVNYVIGDKYVYFKNRGINKYAANIDFKTAKVKLNFKDGSYLANYFIDAGDDENTGDEEEGGSDDNGEPKFKKIYVKFRKADTDKPSMASDTLNPIGYFRENKDGTYTYRVKFRPKTLGIITAQIGNFQVKEDGKFFPVAEEILNEEYNKQFTFDLKEKVEDRIRIKMASVGTHEADIVVTYVDDGSSDEDDSDKELRYTIKYWQDDRELETVSGSVTVGEPVVNGYDVSYDNMPDGYKLDAEHSTEFPFIVTDENTQIDIRYIPEKTDPEEEENTEDEYADIDFEPVDVQMYREGSDDISMANDALNPEAGFAQKGSKYYYRLQFGPKTMNVGGQSLEGHITEFNLNNNGTYEVIKGRNIAGNGNGYDTEFTFVLDTKVSRLPVAFRVDAMGNTLVDADIVFDHGDIEEVELPYTIKYFKDNVEFASMDEVILSTDPRVMSVPDKTPKDYKLDDINSTSLPYTVSENNNLIIIKYIPKNQNAQLKDIEYTVDYYKDGEKFKSEKFTVKSDNPIVTSLPSTAPVGYKVDKAASTKLPYTVSEKQNLIIVKYIKKQNTDIYGLEKGGRYKTKVTLYHATKDKPSMGDKAFSNNRDAYITRDESGYTIELTANPMEFAGVKAGLSGIWSQDEDIIGVISTEETEKGELKYINKFSFFADVLKELYSVEIATDAMPGRQSARLKFDLSVLEETDEEAIANSSTEEEEKEDADKAMPEGAKAKKSMSIKGIAKVDRGRARIVLDAEDMEKKLERLNSSDKTNFVIKSKFKAEEDVHDFLLDMWMSDVKQIEANKASLTLITNDLFVFIPNDSLDSMKKEYGERFKLSIKRKNDIMSVDLKIGDKDIKDFGGEIFIKLDDEEFNDNQVLVELDKHGLEKVVKKFVIADNSLRFKTSDKSIYKLKTIDMDFDDVKPAFWFKSAVQFVYGHEIFKGTSDKIFGPDEHLTRAMLVTALSRIEEEKTDTKADFSDVKADAWYSESVNWAVSKGLVNGEGGKFNPDRNITRQEFAVILYRYMKASKPAEDKLKDFSDGEKVADWAKDAMNWCVEKGVFKGSTGILEPTEEATRAESAVLIKRLIGLKLAE